MYSSSKSQSSKREKTLAKNETETGKAMLFANYSAPQVFAIRMGTPAYQQIHPYNKEMSAGMPASHYKSLVQPSMSKHNKSMSSHLGMNATQIGGKLGNIQ
jgi:5-methylcytosine-specific restriction endonuclease McrBC GTP-binding regulatory subunit McrB